jgi:transposase InsO family protein
MHKLARLTPMGRLRMIRRLEAGERLRAVAAAIDLSPTTVRRWWRRYHQEGEPGLQDRSSRPHRSPRALGRARRRQITRRRQWGWSSLRIARDLQLPLPTVVQVQRRLGLARLPRPARPPVQRYERATPGELVHLDIKKLGRFRRVGHRIHGDHGRRSRGSGNECLHIAIDDRTRLAYAALFPDETAASATAFLALAHRWFAARGVAMRALLTDNGSAYRGRVFGALCGQLGLRHHWTRPYTPQTNGKAERFIRTCLAEWAYQRSYPTSSARASALPAFLRYYNQRRFHMGINGLTPMQRLAQHR